MKFRYSPAIGVFDSRKRIVKRPILGLELKFADGTYGEVPAIIDSGADTTTLNIEYAKALGIKLEEKKEIMGIGSGKVSVYCGQFTFKIKDLKESITVPAWYVDSENVNILLGQEVFFENFRIKFEKDHETFELTEVKR